MKTITGIFLTALILTCSGIDTDTASFFRTKDDPGKNLPENQVYPQGRLFPFSFYSTGGGSYGGRSGLLPETQRAKDQQRIIDGGVTMIGPQYELDKTILADAKRFHTKAIYTLRLSIDTQKVDKNYLRALEKEKKSLDTAKLREAARRAVQEVCDDPAICWWNISPEELRMWRKTERDFLATVSAAVRETDPRKRPFFMYAPGHLSAERLEPLCQYLDIIGKGMYTNYSKAKGDRVFCRWTIEQELEAIRKAGVKGRVAIALPEMFQQPADSELPNIETWARHDVYAAVAAGAKGVLVFSARRRPKFDAWDAYLGAYLKICRELQGELGQATLFGETKNDLTVSVTSGPESVKFKFFNYPEKEYPSIGFANLAYRNSRYLILVNSSAQPVNAVLDGLVYGSGVTVEDLTKPGSRFTAPEGQIELQFKPWGVYLYKVYNVEE